MPSQSCIGRDPQHACTTAGDVHGIRFLCALHLSRVVMVRDCISCGCSDREHRAAGRVSGTLSWLSTRQPALQAGALLMGAGLEATQSSHELAQKACNTSCTGLPCACTVASSSAPMTVHVSIPAMHSRFPPASCVRLMCCSRLMSCAHQQGGCSCLLVARPARGPCEQAQRRDYGTRQAGQLCLHQSGQLLCQATTAMPGEMTAALSSHSSDQRALPEAAHPECLGTCPGAPAQWRSGLPGTCCQGSSRVPLERGLLQQGRSAVGTLGMAECRPCITQCSAHIVAGGGHWANVAARDGHLQTSACDTVSTRAHVRESPHMHDVIELAGGDRQICADCNMLAVPRVFALTATCRLKVRLRDRKVQLRKEANCSGRELQLI
jgi:hypothetical protein